MTPAPAAPSAVAPAPAEGADATSRAVQVVSGAVLGVVSALLMITTHRASASLGGVSIPTGLLLGAVFQVVCCVFLVSSTGRRLPLVVLALVWCLAAMPFAGQSAGGGVIMPASLGGKVQYQGWIVQILGVGIPLVVLAGLWVGRIRRIVREREAATSAGTSR